MFESNDAIHCHCRGLKQLRILRVGLLGYYYGWTTVMRHWLVFRPACLTLQSVINAAARSIAGLCRSEHITDVLASFHWLRAPSASSSNWQSLCTELFTALHLSTYRVRFSSNVADLPSRRRGRLRSSTSSLLDVRPSRLVTVGDRSFAAAIPRL